MNYYPAMKFKVTHLDKELEFKQFKKINVFVGIDAPSISEFFYQKEKENDILTYMHLGSKWHYTQIEDRLSLLLNIVIKSNITLFVYINSLEVIQFLPTLIEKKGLKNDFQMIRIGKSVLTSNKGNPIATYISCDELKAMIEMPLEMR